MVLPKVPKPWHAEVLWKIKEKTHPSKVFPDVGKDGCHTKGNSLSKALLKR